MDKKELQIEVSRMFFPPATSLKLEYNDSNGRVHTYRANVTLTEESFLELTLQEKEETTPLQPGSELILIIGDKQPFVHYFKSQVIALDSGSEIVSLKVTLPQKTSVSALRSFFRCDITLPFSYLIEGVLEFQGETKNLSAGGLLGIIKYDSALAVDMNVDIRFQLPTLPQPFVFPSQIVRLESAPSHNQLMAVKFLKISEANQNQIIKYLFQYQRELKAKKVL